MPEVIRAADCGNSPKNQRAEDIALALFGAGDLPEDMIAQDAVWDRAGGALSGREAILDAIAPEGIVRIAVDQVVTHGRAGSVSGRITRAGQTRLFCHVIRFSSASARQIAHIVSFEHPGGV
jgi:hypothetical protein